MGTSYLEGKKSQLCMKDNTVKTDDCAVLPGEVWRCPMGPDAAGNTGCRMSTTRHTANGKDWLLESLCWRIDQ